MKRNFSELQEELKQHPDYRDRTLKARIDLIRQVLDDMEEQEDPELYGEEWVASNGDLFRDGRYVGHVHDSDLARVIASCMRYMVRIRPEGSESIAT